MDTNTGNQRRVYVILGVLALVAVVAGAVWWLYGKDAWALLPNQAEQENVFLTEEEKALILQDLTAPEGGATIPDAEREAILEQLTAPADGQ